MSGESTPSMELSYDAVCFDLFGTLVDGNGNAIEGASEALRLLPPARWAIVTSCGSGYARALLASAGLPEPLVLVAADHVQRGKPSGEPYERGAQKLGYKRVLVVEDSRDGIAAGRAAGLDVLAILRGRGLDFARAASFQVERFADIRWRVASDDIFVTI